MALLECKRISAAKLAEMFEVSPRTIFRDIETINMAGIPVTAYPGVNGGISIMEQYKIDKKLFTTSDIATLLQGLRSISATISSEEVVHTLAKVKSLIAAEQIADIELKAQQISIDLTTWAGNKNFQPNLAKIKKALNENKLLSFRYYDNSGRQSHRQVEPYQLVLKEVNWYLQGYCLLRKDFRVFKLSRISGLEILDSTFVPREFHEKPLDGSDWIAKRIVMIKPLVEESLREQIIERCGEENIRPYGANKLIVNFPFVEDEMGYNLLLSFGDKCECLEPENVRLELINRIKRMIDIYTKSHL
jgi:predicted DNA-binding transcriptional regulator YafY